jgi:muconate cycloisomerase
MTEQTLTFTHFRVWQVSVPGRQDINAVRETSGAIYRDNLTWPLIPIHLVEGVTSAGFSAVGECERGTSEAAVTNTLRELLGQNLLEMSPATAWMQPYNAVGLPMSYPFWSWQSPDERSYWILESLWVDAVGKATGLPTHRLFGGAVREVVAADFWANRPPAATLAALVAEAVDRGLRGLKMKCDSTGDTVKSLVAIAQDVPPDFRFTIDPMCAWRSLRESARYFEQLARLPNPIQIEDPFPPTVVEDWRRARQLGPMTIVCHAGRAELLRHALREEMADAYNLGGGSCTEFLQTAQVAEFFSKDCWQGSSIELGVLQALRLHAAACARNCLLASDLCSEWVREHTLVTPRMAYRDAGAVVPNRPGLGVALDHAAVEKYTVKKFEIE